MTLNLHPEPASRNKSKNYKKTLRVGGAISLVGVGSTFAANITLNNDQNVEFGQGVAQTLACDDQVNINPVSYYDNTSGTFRLDYIEVSGINLIPVGAISDSYNSSTGGYDTYADSTAIAAHPGQYFDSGSSAWTNTCDQVVLDFKAFTNDTKYSTNTLDGYAAINNNVNATPNTISSPLLLSIYSPQGDGIAAANYTARDPNWAVVFDAQSFDGNKGVMSANGNGREQFEIDYPSSSGGTGFVRDSSFKLSITYGHHYRGWVGTQSSDTAAGAISKITVESMKYFPSDYQLDWDPEPGTFGKRP